MLQILPFLLKKNSQYRSKIYTYIIINSPSGFTCEDNILFRPYGGRQCLEATKHQSSDQPTSSRRSSPSWRDSWGKCLLALFTMNSLLFENGLRLLEDIVCLKKSYYNILQCKVQKRLIS